MHFTASQLHKLGVEGLSFLCGNSSGEASVPCRANGDAAEQPEAQPAATLPQGAASAAGQAAEERLAAAADGVEESSEQGQVSLGASQVRC